jgi:hypothetical protein
MLEIAKVIIIKDSGPHDWWVKKIDILAKTPNDKQVEFEERRWSLGVSGLMRWGM